MPVHHLMVGTWSPPGAIFTFAFDDEKLTLELIKRTPILENEPVSWITFDQSKKNIYGAAKKNWSSFAVESPTSIVHQASYPMPHNCEYSSSQAPSSSFDTRAIFVLAAKHPPFAVYCNPFYSNSGQGSIFSVSPNGALAENIQNYNYQPDSGIHLWSLIPKESIFTPQTSRPTRSGFTGVESVPQSLILWAVLAVVTSMTTHVGNRLCEYTICPTTHLLVYTERHYPLIPPGIPSRSQYRADVMALSHSSSYLFASSRGTDDLTGYIAAFKLHESGAIERQICLNPTPTSGGHSNAVSPSDWTDEWVAITDDQEGWLEVYRWQDEFLGRVARVRVPEPGFGMNAIWYD